MTSEVISCFITKKANERYAEAASVCSEANISIIF